MEDELPKRPLYWIPTAYFIIGAVVIWMVLAFVPDEHSNLTVVIWFSVPFLFFPSGLLSLYMLLVSVPAGTLTPVKQSLVVALIMNTIALLIFMKWRDNQV